MLDTPSFFWDSEPTLHPLYSAVREYLEIKPRIQVLNERCQVFLDLGEILSDSINDKKMTRITWIVIFLIIVSIMITCIEVILRFTILTSAHGKDQAAIGVAALHPAGLRGWSGKGFAGPSLLAARGLVWAAGSVKGLVV
jgi:hypothetical protein